MRVFLMVGKLKAQIPRKTMKILFSVLLLAAAAAYDGKCKG